MSSMAVPDSYVVLNQPIVPQPYKQIVLVPYTHLQVRINQRIEQFLADFVSRKDFSHGVWNLYTNSRTRLGYSHVISAQIAKYLNGYVRLSIGDPVISQILNIPITVVKQLSSYQITRETLVWVQNYAASLVDFSLEIHDTFPHKIYCLIVPDSFVNDDYKSNEITFNRGFDENQKIENNLEEELSEGLDEEEEPIYEQESKLQKLAKSINKTRNPSSTNRDNNKKRKKGEALEAIKEMKDAISQVEKITKELKEDIADMFSYCGDHISSFGSFISHLKEHYNEMCCLIEPQFGEFKAITIFTNYQRDNNIEYFSIISPSLYSHIDVGMNVLIGPLVDDIYHSLPLFYQQPSVKKDTTTMIGHTRDYHSVICKCDVNEMMRIIPFYVGSKNFSSIRTFDPPAAGGSKGGNGEREESGP